MRSMRRATFVVAFVVCFSGGASRAAELIISPPVIDPADLPAVSELACQLATAPSGEVLCLPDADYRLPPTGLRPFSLPVSVTYTWPNGQTAVRVIVEGDPSWLRPGLVFTVAGELDDGQAVSAQLVVHHLTEVETDVPVQGQPAQRQQVPYLCAWGPVNCDVSRLKGRRVILTQPITTPTQAAEQPPTPVPTPSGGLVPPDQPTPTSVPAPTPVVGMATPEVARARALDALLQSKSVGEIMGLPDWVVACPATAPESWTSFRTLRDDASYPPGRVVALIQRRDGQALTWVRALVVGVGDEPMPTGERYPVTYVWASRVPPAAAGAELFISTAVPPGCPGSADPH